MGLSGGRSRGLPRHFDPNGLAAAQALLEGDYGAAARIIARQRRLAAERRQAETEAKARRGAESSRAAMLEAFGYGQDLNAGLFRHSGPRAPSLFTFAAAAQPHETGTTTFTHNVPLPARPEIPFERLWAGIEFVEGGVGPDGAFRTSRAGAVGPAQVKPRTAPEAARLAGLPWDEHRYRTDAQYNIAFGRAYFRQQLRDFHVPEIAAAAYNWGPFALRQAIRESKRTGTKLENLMPAETLKHVARFRRYLEDY